MNKHDNTTKRLECSDWDDGATIAVTPHGAGQRIAKKVLTTGIVSINLTRTQWQEIIGNLSQGKEVRLAHDGVDMIRLFPCAEGDLAGMFVCAQTMGDFRHEPYVGKSLKYTTRKCTMALSKTKVEKLVRRARQKDPEREHVSPETVVKCPNCGTEFKVGKSLK